MSFLAEHQLLVQILAGLAAAILAPSVAWLGLRPRPAAVEPVKPVAVEGRHHSGLTAADRPYAARHAHPELPAYQPHHAATGAGPAVALGHTPDGELALLDDTHELVMA